MEVVIKIPDRIYKMVQNRTLNIVDYEIVEKAIKDGEPLPKGHGDLIDTSELLTTTQIRDDGSEMTYVAYTEIEQAPRIIRADKEIRYENRN